MRIGVEVTARKRPADLPWVTEQWAKHQTLPTDKLVLVAQSGFTKDAERFAGAHGVEAVKFRAGGDSLPWQTILGKVVQGFVTLVQREGMRLRIVYATKPPRRFVEAAACDGVLVDSAGTPVATPEKYAWREFAKLERPPLPDSVRETSFHVEWLLPGWRIQTQNEGSWPITRLRFDVNETRTTGLAAIDEGVIGDSVFVSLSNVELGVGLVTVQRKGRPPIACAFQTCPDGRTICEATEPMGGFG